MTTKSFNIDPLNLPDEEKFDEMKKKIIESTIITPREITEIAYLYRKEFVKAKEIYEIALNKVDVENSKQINDIKIYILGLKTQHGVAKESDFYEMSMVEDKRLDLLKGFYLYNKREYGKAYLLFSKIDYRMGMCLTSAESQNSGIYEEINEAKIACYSNSRLWKEYKKKDENIDFLYRIGQSERYENENNIDVILRRIEDELKEGCGNDRLEEHIQSLVNLKNTYNNSTEILYLLGKINHIRENYEIAKEYYMQVLAIDGDYMPAVLNLCKINGEMNLKNSKYTAINDAIALISIKNKKYDVNINECSDCVRKICRLVIKDIKNETSIINDYEQLILGNYFKNIQDGSEKQIINGWISKDLYEGAEIGEILFEKEAIYNNLAILEKDKKKSCDLLVNALSFGSEEYEDYLKYNLGVLKEDIELLRSLHMKEAKLQISLLKKDANIDCDKLKAYILHEQNLEESERLFKKIAEENEDVNKLYADIWLGCINIDKYLKTNKTMYLEEASKFFMKNVRSFYSVNGLGVIEYLYGRYKYALKYFEFISGEYDKVFYNIACCHISMKNYSKAAEMMTEYLKIHNWDIKAKSLLDFCNVQAKGNDNYFLNDDLVKMENYTVISKQNFKVTENEAERKRKIEDVLEARKKLNLN